MSSLQLDYKFSRHEHIFVDNLPEILNDVLILSAHRIACASMG